MPPGLRRQGSRHEGSARAASAHRRGGPEQRHHAHLHTPATCRRPGTPAHTCAHLPPAGPRDTCVHLHTHHLYEPMDTCAHLQICSHVRGHTRLHTAAHTPEPALRLVRPPVSCVPGHSDLSLHLLLRTCGLFPETAPTAVRPERPLWHTQGLGRSCPTHRVAMGATRSSEKSLREMLVTWQATPWPHTGTGLTPVLAMARMHWPGRDSQPQVTRLAGSQGTS